MSFSSSLANSLFITSFISLLILFTTLDPNFLYPNAYPLLKGIVRLLKVIDGITVGKRVQEDKFIGGEMLKIL
jgi:hypothetical protein